MGKLEGKVAWITGASSGIGEATARALAREGARLVLSARRADRLDTLAAEIRSNGGTVAVRALDVSDASAVDAAGRAMAAEGGVDILINNAGIMPLAPLVEGRVDEWNRTIDVNVKGLLYVIHAVLGGMIARSEGHIVNISSIAGRVCFPGGAVYCGTKFAVRAISETLRKEVAQMGIRVTDIAPGAVNTELPLSIGSEAVRAAVTHEGGFYGQPEVILQSEDIAEAILYAVTQPKRVDVCEVVVRPTIQEL